MANLSKIIYINEEDYSTLVNGGTITKNGQTYSYDSGALYVIKDVSAPEYAETAGYAQSASRARYDYYGNSISDTYQLKPLIIEVGSGDTDVPSGTFDSIYLAILDERDVIVKCDDGNEFYYLPLVYDSSRIDEYYYFLSTNYTTFFRIAIMNDDSISIDSYNLSKDNDVVHKASAETITGDKTFTGSVSLGSKATATTPAAGDNDTSVATTAFVLNAVNGITVETGAIVGRLHRDDVTGTGQITIKGNSGEGFGSTGITTAGEYTVIVYSWSTTQSYGYNISFGGISYTVSTTNGTISDKRTLTVSAGALWTASVTNAVAAGTTLIVEIYDANKMTPALSVGTVALTNLYADLDGKPTIPSAPGTLNTNNTTALTASSSEALSGTIKLHKVSKTGNYEDLLDKPDIPIINAVTETYSSTAADTKTPFTASIWRVDLSDKVTELYSGLTILIKVPVAGNGTYGTLLRIDGVNSADDSSENLYPVCANVTTMVSTRYAVGCIIALTFDATLAGQTLYYNSDSAYTTTASGTGWTKPGCWKIADYSTGDTTTGREGYYYFRPYAGQAVYRYKFLMEGADGRLYPIVTTNQTSATSVTKTPTTVGLRPWKIWYYSHTDTVSAGSAFGAQRVYPEMYTTTATYNFNAATGTYAWIFLLGSYNKDTDLFTLDTGNNYYKFVRYNAAINWASSLTAGKYYILLGSSYSTTNYVLLFNVNPFYYFDGTNLIPVSTKIAKDSAPIQSISVNGTTLTITNGNVDLTMSGGSLPNGYAPATGSNEDLVLEGGDTYDEAFAKLDKTIQDDSYVISTALNDLNLRVNTNAQQILTKQDELVSGVNIKTINNESILGDGNITITAGAGENNVQSDWEESDSTSDAFIKNKPTIPAAVTESTVSGWGFTKNTGTITGITMNGTSRGTSGVINLGTVLTSHLDISGKADKSAAIGSLSLTMDSTNYKITLSGTKVDGTTFTVSDVIDLPLESVVVNGSYDSNTKKVILTLKNGSTIDFSVADLISGLLSEITSSNKLSADLVQNGTTNKVYTATEKTKLAGIAAGAEVNVQSDWNESDESNDSFIRNKPTIPENVLSSNYAPSTLTNDDLALESGDDYEEAFGKLEKTIVDNELITASALIDLNNRLLDSKPLWVTFEVESDEGVSCDTAISDIVSAINEGKAVLGKMEGLGELIFYPSMFVDDGVSFSSQVHSFDPDSIYDLTFLGVEESDEDSWEKDLQLVTTNIGNIAINGNVITPDSSRTVDIDLSNYDKTPLIIEVGNSVTTVPAGTYASITTALSNGRKVFVKVYTDQGEGNIDYCILPLVEKYYVEDDEDSYYFSASEYSTTFNATILSNDDFGYMVKYHAQESHNHGNIQLDGSLQFGDITIANGDKLVVTDNSNLNIVARTSITFDASTTTKALTPKGTWETFYQKPSMGIPSSDLASSVQTSLGLANSALLSHQSIKTINNNTITGTGNITIATPGTLKSDNTTAQTTANNESLSGVVNLHKISKTGNYNDLIDKPTIPAAVTESTVSGWGFTKNTGTVTGITMNGTSKGTSGVIDLGTVLTAHQDISGKANTADLATVATSGSYNDLSNKPTIPSLNTNLFTVEQGTTSLNSATGSLVDELNDLSQAGDNTFPTSTAVYNAIVAAINAAKVTIYSGTATPSSSLGTNGDLYLQTS